MSSDIREKSLGEEKVVMCTHASHCGGMCLLKVHVQDGIITRIETDDGEEPQFRACAKGRAYRQRVYSPDRLKYPLERVGVRGEGKFECISWDEALDTVAGELTRIKETYGPASILYRRSGGDMGQLGDFLHYHLLCLAGGCSEVWAMPSSEGADFNMKVTFGVDHYGTANSPDNLLDSRLIILWGFNPAVTQQQRSFQYLLQARDKGIKIISVDPVYHTTAALCADQWIPIKPGTDAAMAIAMAYVIIDETLQDQDFLDKYTVGFDIFKDYVLGKDDGILKTPQWAEAITGVPAETIENLARQYANMKPAALIGSFGPGRSAYGEQFHRAASTLAAMTGNIGIKGGDAGASPTFRSRESIKIRFPALTRPPNPLKAKAPAQKNDSPEWRYIIKNGSVHVSKIADAILKGKAGGYPVDYKMLYFVNTSYPVQYLNVNKSVEALKSENLEFILMFEQFMTPGAKFADIILPVNTCLERNDIFCGGYPPFYGFMGKAVDSIGESKSHLEISKALADKLGIEDFITKTEEEILVEGAATSPDITDYDDLKKTGMLKLVPSEPHVSFKKQIEDPENNPFPTPSGKIEIFSQQLADMNDPLLPPVPKYIEPWEGSNDPLTQKYPLQLITTHYWRRAHSQYDNIPWLREIEDQPVHMNSVDANARDIKNGDLVRVFNERGMTLLHAVVTERIMPGVVDIPPGAWYDPDENGVDRGGCANILTRDEPSPGGAYPTNTALVQVEKI